MASTVSKKRLRRSIKAPGHHTAAREKHPRRNAPNPMNEQNWLERAREARAHTPLSADSTELLRELRAAAEPGLRVAIDRGVTLEPCRRPDSPA